MELIIFPLLLATSKYIFMLRLKCTKKQVNAQCCGLMQTDAPLMRGCA